LDGVPAPAQVPGDRSQAVPVGQQGVHRGVAAAGAVGCTTSQLGDVGVRDRRGRFLLYLGVGFGGAQTASVTGHAPLDGFAQVLPQVEPVGDLHRVRRSGTGALGIRSRPVPADHVHAWVRAQPVTQPVGIAAGQQVQRLTGFAVDQHGAVVLATAQREVVHAQDPRHACGRVG
jgi:hypothetical protein